MAVVCTACGKSYPDTPLICDHCGNDDFRPEVSPGPGSSGPGSSGPGSSGPGSDDQPVIPDTTENQPRSVCWNCGTPSPNPTNTECLVCRRPLAPPSLVIRFPTGQVELTCGTSVELGRDGPYSSVFTCYRNVSGRHAVVGVDDRGHPWIRPIPEAPNGTFVNGLEITAGQPHHLHDGDTVRLAATITGSVHRYT